MGIWNNLFSKNNNNKICNNDQIEKNKRRDLNYKLRDEFWHNIGEVDKDVLSFLINPAFTGQPRWPDLRQSYKKIKTENSIILATDGLSDEYTESKESNNGLEIELYVEISDPEYRNKSLSELKQTWFFQLLYQTSLNAVNLGVFKSYFEKYGVFSLEVYDANVPKRFYNENNSIGVLIGMESVNVPNKVKLLEKEVNILSVTILTFEELNYIIENGSSGRKKLVNKMKENGFNNISSIQRNSVLA